MRKLNHLLLILLIFLTVSSSAIAYSRTDLLVLLKAGVRDYDDVLTVMTETEFRDLIRLYFITPETNSDVETTSSGIYSGTNYDTLITSLESTVEFCSPGELMVCGSDVGECSKGTQTCLSTGAWSICVGQVVPSEETCDNLDNDCDNEIDEGFLMIAPLGGGANVCCALSQCADGGSCVDEGGVSSEGTYKCSSGTWVYNCVAGALNGVCDSIICGASIECDGVSPSTTLQLGICDASCTYSLVEPDSSNSVCAVTNYDWLAGGESSAFGEYDTGTSTECCGDDSGENSLSRQTDCTLVTCNANDYPEFSVDVNDAVCCNDPDDTVFGGVCYTSDNDGGPPYRFEDGSISAATGGVVPNIIAENSVWYDCDNSRGACEELVSDGRCGLTWEAGGEAAAFGEYNTGTVTECCGDDSGENLRSTLQGASTFSACCSAATDCVDSDGNCIADGGLSGDGVYTCSSGTWDVLLLCEDLDGDGFDAISPSCPTGNDCLDSGSFGIPFAVPAAWIFPGQTEVCDNVDEDCDGVVDEGCDDDNDNYCDEDMNVLSSVFTCPLGGGDCNDNPDTGGADVYPGNEEVCDGLDNDCDGDVDYAGCVAPPPPSSGGDLDVIFIERTPKNPSYRVTYFTNRDACSPENSNYYLYSEDRGPQLCPNEAGKKRWPDSGETVTFTAHIKNNDIIATGNFDYEWFIDGVEVKSGTHTSIDAGQRTTETFQWQWPPTLDNHKVKFVADPLNLIIEAFETNNELDDDTNALSIGIFFDPDAYAEFKTTIGSSSPSSPEDWIQRNIKRMNELFATAGVQERVRVDKLFISSTDWDPDSSTPDYVWRAGVINDDVDSWNEDGWWGVQDDHRVTSGYYDSSEDIDYGMLHEIIHQLGIIDLYNMQSDTNYNQLWDNNLNRVGAGCGTEYGWLADWDCFKHPDNIGNDLANSVYPGIGEHTANALNKNLHKRRGYFGEYLFDVPDTIKVKFLKSNGQPLDSATVKIYRQSLDRIIDSSKLTQTHTTDSNGIITLDPLTGSWADTSLTETNHQLKANPFGLIDVVGRNGLFLFEIEKGNYDYKWLALTSVNLEYWKGNTAEATFTITTSLT